MLRLRGDNAAARTFLSEENIMPIALLVEDHPMNRKLFRDILAFEFEVVEAESAEVARDRLQSCTPDLILMDLQLPGMDGLTYTRELKADVKTADIPVVAVSAHAMTQDIEAARAAGCVTTLPSPSPTTLSSCWNAWSSWRHRNQESGIKEAFTFRAKRST